MTEERQIFINTFPSSYSTDVESLFYKFNWVTNRFSRDSHELIFNGQILKIPCRIYYEEPIPRDFTEKEKYIIDCLFTRHHDGFIREKMLRNILKSENTLSTLFIAQLLGEYVVEILNIIYENLTPTLLDNFINFKLENPIFFTKTEQRVQSYWYCYYKWRMPRKLDYAGFKILDEIQKRSELHKSVNLL